MTALTELTWESIRQLFPLEHHATAARLPEAECGNNLPFLEEADANTLERVQLADLERSDGTLEGLRQAVELAKVDWRDLLMAAHDSDAPDRKAWWRVRRPK